MKWEKIGWWVLITAKCEIIRITNVKHPKRLVYHSWTSFQMTSKVKYLWVTIDITVSWRQHARNITRNANSTLAFLRRKTSSYSKNIWETRYKTWSDYNWSVLPQYGVPPSKPKFQLHRPFHVKQHGISWMTSDGIAASPLCSCTSYNLTA